MMDYKMENLEEKIISRLVELIEEKAPTREEIDVLRILSDLLIGITIHHRMNFHS